MTCQENLFTFYETMEENILNLLHGRALGKDAAKNVMRYGEGSVAHQKIIGLTIELKGSEKGLRFLKFD